MAKLAKSPRRSHWDNLSDEQLLDTELETDDPDSLPGIIDYLPEGYLSAFVEFKYDLRGAGCDKFICVHGKHKHLAGFIMNKDGVRFKFGWICAETTYGANFKAYRADYDAVVNRQKVARRRREITRIALEIDNWIGAVFASNTFLSYEETRDRISTHLPWIWDNAHRTPNFDLSLRDITSTEDIVPSISPEKRLRQIYKRLHDSLTALRSDSEMSLKQEGAIKAQIDGVMRGAEGVVVQLGKLVDFFQPAVLRPLCEFATEADNPTKRQYEAGFLSIVCYRGKKASIHVGLPSNFKLPDREQLNELREMLRIV